jgi:hypothetical protein
MSEQCENPYPLHELTGRLVKIYSTEGNVTLSQEVALDFIGFYQCDSGDYIVLSHERRNGTFYNSYHFKSHIIAVVPCDEV